MDLPKKSKVEYFLSLILSTCPIYTKLHYSYFTFPQPALQESYDSHEQCYSYNIYCYKKPTIRNKIE